MCWCVQDCELAELRLTVDKLRNSPLLPPSLSAACSSASPAAAAAGKIARNLLRLDCQTVTVTSNIETDRMDQRWADMALLLGYRHTQSSRCIWAITAVDQRWFGYYVLLQREIQLMSCIESSAKLYVVVDNYRRFWLVNHKNSRQKQRIHLFFVYCLGRLYYLAKVGGWGQPEGDIAPFATSWLRLWIMCIFYFILLVLPFI